ncbi:M48 family metallopeptidase [Rhizobium phaseoli]|uniref:M48 family metallopeptidase n=1 Tax=Rhizobium phaseoli TaxID=396 RepID=UPI001F2C9806|nr:SprT family zinc-dependent metalloprotease [Rhizobium phaseoli]
MLEFTVRRRDRQTLEIAVQPDASVIVTAPVGATVEAIKAKVRTRAAWILKQQLYFRQFLPRAPEKMFVSGETHLYLGRQYRLRVSTGLKDHVSLTRGFIEVSSTRPKNNDFTRNLLNAWYLQRAHVKYRERLEVALERFAVPEDFRPTGLMIRQLEMRWGSMSPTKRLVLNKRLIQAPVDSIDYVITHELCHIAEPNHGTHFYSFLGRVMPDWPKRKQKLEEILA